jgi:predicted amidohydrolase YtcJ
MNSRYKVRTATFLSITLGLLLTACGGQDTTPEEIPTAGEVDLVLTNGKVFVADADFSIVNTVVVNDGLIVASGDDSLLDRYDAAETVDLEGKLLIPGFIDSHTHIRGRPQRYIELGEVTSIAEIQELISAKIEEIGEGEWITGYGWSEDELDEGRRPLRADLDAVAPDNPVILTRAGGHSAVTNSLALELGRRHSQHAAARGWRDRSRG